MDDKNQIGSLEKGLNILSLLSQRGSPIRLEELTRITGMKKTTCFRFLQTLKRLNYVEQDPESKKYWLGTRIISLGLSALNNLNIRKLALPFMKKLREETGETVNLSVLDGTDIVFIERLQSSFIVDSNLHVGSRLPVYCTSMGKAILAHLPEAKVEEILSQIHFEKRTEKTIVSPKSLREELKKVRARGFAINDQELEKGLYAVAAPILNHNGEAIAAMNISFPSVRHPREESIIVFSKMVLKACAEISSSLGFVQDR